jgi:hypothetical protein
MSRRDRYRATTRTVETVWIPLSDGRRLAARLFLPKTADKSPVPVIMEYIPYRRRDNTRLGDDEMHLWFAANGYAVARVDIAGTGDSDGLIGDEYVKREQDDGCEAIEWLGSQPWCSGNVGMIGISWGGFSSLQIAARRPPRLKAIVSMYSSDDRFGCDAHYFGGCLLNDTVHWGGAFFNFAAQPPDPAVVGDENWRTAWKRRIDNLSLIPADWLRHQRRDDFWRQGSVCEDYGAIECAVLAVGGLLDGYTRTVFRLVENLTAPCKGIIGPWGHKEPQIGFPGPAIGFLQECKRWWDYWLKGVDNGVDRDPAMRIWLQDSGVLDPSATERPGRWLAFPSWPAAGIKPRQFFLSGDKRLTRNVDDVVGGIRQIRSPMTTGYTAQEWCPFGQGRIAPEAASDQREDDAQSLCFDSDILPAPLKIIGVTQVKLRLRANKPQALVAVRLTDVAPDGTSALIGFGVLNLAHRRSHETPEPLTPGRFYDVTMPLKPVAQIVPKGHQIRVAISNAYWPMVWPSPDNVTLELNCRQAEVILPVLTSIAGVRSAAFEAPEYAPHGEIKRIVTGSQKRHRHFDVAEQRLELVVDSVDGRHLITETGTEVAASIKRTLSIQRNDPNSASSQTEYSSEFKRADWHARLETTILITSDRKRFRVRGTLRAFDGDKLFAERLFDQSIARDNM